MKIRLRRPFAAAVVVLALVAAACGSNKSPSSGGSSGPAFTTIKSGVLTVGSCLDYSPFEYYQHGQLKGFDVEIMQNIAQRLGLKLEWIKANFKTIFTALDGGQFDAVAAASTITAQREQVVDFSQPYYDANQSLTVNVKKTPTLTNVNQLKKGDVIGAQAGTTGRDWVKEHLVPKGIQLKEYTNAPDAFTDLEAGNIIGIVNDEPSSRSEVLSRPDLKVVQPIVTKEQYGIALRKQNSPLESAVNHALSSIILDGTYAKLFKKYFPKLLLPYEFRPKK
jgi:polar amino acid transport system substrate-binding protein